MKTATRQPVDPLEALASERDAGEAIDSWLSVMARLMRLPGATRSDICDELREHLHERVRDLLLSGGGNIGERDAVRLAIEELGETAHLARRFEAANQPRTRRLLMHALLALTGIGALSAAVMTFSPNQSELNGIVRFGEPVVAQPPPSMLTDARIEVHQEMSLRDAVTTVADRAGVGLMVDWGSIEESGIDSNFSLGLSFKDMPGPRALSLIAQHAGGRGNTLDWRARENNLIEFGVRQNLDAREIELVTYDITSNIHMIAGNFADSREEAASQITGLITQLATPDYWRDNGGDLAQLQLVGGRLFVEAPGSTHAKLKWILDQLPRSPEAQAKADAAGDAAPDEDLGVVRRVLNPGDTITLSVFELYQPNVWHTATRQIDEAGRFRVAELGDMRAAGFTEAQFESKVATRLKEQVMKVQPKVEVIVENAAVMTATMP